MKELTEKERDLFCEALGFADLAARSAFLDRACAGDGVMRKRLEQLLALQPTADRFFADAATWMQNPPPDSPGSGPAQLNP